MRYIKTFEMKKQTPRFSVGDNIICVFPLWGSDLKKGKIYEIERCTWSRRKHTFVYKLKGIGSEDKDSYFSENNFISELENDIEKYNL
jgi:hypothetical protein